MNDIERTKQFVSDLYRQKKTDLIQTGSARLYTKNIELGMDETVALSSILSYGVKFEDLMFGLEKLQVTIK